MLILLTIIAVMFVSAMCGLAVYLVFGSWVAFLIAFLGSIIAVCVTVGIVKIIKFFKDGKDNFKR